MKKQDLKSSIAKKDQEIQLLKLILRAIHKIKEKKHRKSEKNQLKDFESELLNL